MVTDFYNNVFKLLTSISIAQLIPIIITPILTQYFTPEDFGVYGLYVSICSIFGIVASGKYDVAIMLPKKKEDSINILFLSFLITFLFSTFCFSLLNIFDDVFFKLTNSKFLKEYYFIIPISIFLISMNQSLIVWFNRNKKYNTIANQNLLKSGSNSGSSLILGIQSIHVGLIISHLISLIIISFWNIVHFMQECNKYNINQKLIRRNFLKYIDFLKFSTVSNLFNSFSNIGMTALIVIFFGPKIAGLYFLAEKLIAIPISFITSSVSQVYFQQASKLFHSNKKELIKKILKIIITINLLKTIIYSKISFFFLITDLFLHLNLKELK